MTNLKITKPFQNYTDSIDKFKTPCWFFHGVDIPEINYDEMDWESSLGEPLQNDDLFALRFIASEPQLTQNIRTKPLIDHLNSIQASVMSEIRENHCEGMDVDKTYPVYAWRYQSKNASIQKQLKGFKMGRHLDNRNAKFTFLLNLEDNNESTYFLTRNFKNSPDDKEVIMGPTKKGSGVFFFNYHTLLHGIGPITSDTRYIFFLQQFMT